jgi:hypothetical protein
MAFPKIEECLICEMVRPELGGKLSLLGFFGRAPHVQIIVQNLDLPLQQLAFVFLGGPYQPSSIEPPFQIKLLVIGPAGDEVAASPPVSLAIPPAPHRTTLATGVGNIRLPKTGRYEFSLLVDNVSEFQSYFFVSVGPPNPVIVGQP